MGREGDQGMRRQYLPQLRHGEAGHQHFAGRRAMHRIMSPQRSEKADRPGGRRVGQVDDAAFAQPADPGALVTLLRQLFQERLRDILNAQHGAIGAAELERADAQPVGLRRGVLLDKAHVLQAA